MQTTEPKITFHTYVSGKGRVSLMLWNTGASEGITFSTSLTERQARALGTELIAAADKMPRVASEADLGIAA